MIGDNTGRQANNPLQTIEEYLDLSDWTFKPGYEIGSHGDFYWIRYDYQIDPLQFINLPKSKYRALLLDFDSGPPGKYFGNDPGWSALGEFALSDAGDSLPNLRFGAADTAYLLLTQEFDQVALLEQLGRLEEPHQKTNQIFWEVMDAVKPFCYCSDCGGTFFVSPYKASIDILYSSKVLQIAEDRAREGKRKSRLELWQTLGPERGPEKCVEQDCERLRIELAVRCFMHQLQSR